MLKSVGTDYVLAGHSERRAVFGDSDEDTNKKALKILAEGLKCILCVGELKEERESGETFNVCDVQLTKGLAVRKTGRYFSFFFFFFFFPISYNSYYTS